MVYTTDLKSVAFGIAGSNPASPISKNADIAMQRIKSRFNQIWKYIKSPIQYSYLQYPERKDHIIRLFWFSFIVYSDSKWGKWHKPEKFERGWNFGKVIYVNLIKEFPIDR